MCSKLKAFLRLSCGPPAVLRGGGPEGSAAPLSYSGHSSAPSSSLTSRSSSSSPHCWFITHSWRVCTAARILRPWGCRAPQRACPHNPRTARWPAWPWALQTWRPARRFSSSSAPRRACRTWTCRWSTTRRGLEASGGVPDPVVTGAVHGFGTALTLRAGSMNVRIEAQDTTTLANFGLVENFLGGAPRLRVAEKLFIDDVSGTAAGLKTNAVSARPGDRSSHHACAGNGRRADLPEPGGRHHRHHIREADLEELQAIFDKAVLKCYDRTDVPHKGRLGFVAQDFEGAGVTGSARLEDQALSRPLGTARSCKPEWMRSRSPRRLSGGAAAAHSASDHAGVDRGRDLAAQYL